MTATRRDHLLETALRMFYRHGFHATGIDAILAESGVAKMTLYKHFGSKEELILAALVLRDERWRAWLDAAIGRAGPAPRDRLLAVFDALVEWFADPGFAGCLFVRAAAEFPDPAHPAHREAARHKQRVRERQKNMARRGRRAVYDLDPALIEAVKEIAEQHSVPASQVAALLLSLGLEELARDAVNLNDLKVPSDSPRYEWTLDLGQRKP